MNKPMNVLAVSGSTRLQSSNILLIRAIAALFASRINITLYDRIATLPHFNPDLENDSVPVSVSELRSLIDAADGVLICTPEYAHGVPGTLKNAIDWTVSSNNFYNKPVMLVTASTDGRCAHQAMMEILKVIGAENTVQLQLLVQFIKTRINSAGEITDEILIKDLNHRIALFCESMSNPQP